MAGIHTQIRIVRWPHFLTILGMVFFFVIRKKPRVWSTRLQIRLSLIMFYRKRGFSFPYLRCLQLEEGIWVLKELHVEEYSNDIQAQSLCIKALQLGYYWPTMRVDSKKTSTEMRKMSKCAHVLDQPSSFLYCLTRPWPFAQWGIDIVGALK